MMSGCWAEEAVLHMEREGELVDRLLIDPHILFQAEFMAELGARALDRRKFAARWHESKHDPGGQ